MTTALYTNARFAEAVAYLTKVTAQWAAEALMLPEGHDQPVPRHTIDRFCEEVRQRVTSIERMALQSWAEEHRASVLPKVHAILEAYEKDPGSPGRTIDQIRDALGRLTP